MKKTAAIFSCLWLAMFVVICISESQQTPSQIVSAGSEFYRLSPIDLEVAKSTLLSQLVYGAVVSPSSIISNGASFYGLDYQGHQVAQTYLLSQIQAGGSFLQSPWLTDINGAGKGLTNVNFIIATNALGLITSNNAYIGGSLTIIGDIGTVQNIAVNGTATFTLGLQAHGTSNFVFGLVNCTSNIVASNYLAYESLQLRTNYIAANFVPIAGIVKVASSNGVLYKVTQLSTQLMTSAATP